MTWNDIGFAAFALLRNVVYLLVALGVLVLVLEVLFRYMNNSLGITFRGHAWKVISKNPVAVAVYFGLRVFGVLIACGMVASAFLK